MVTTPPLHCTVFFLVFFVSRGRVHYCDQTTTTLYSIQNMLAELKLFMVATPPPHCTGCVPCLPQIPPGYEPNSIGSFPYPLLPLIIPSCFMMYWCPDGTHGVAYHQAPGRCSESTSVVCGSHVTVTPASRSCCQLPVIRHMSCAAKKLRGPTHRHYLVIRICLGYSQFSSLHFLARNCVSPPCTVHC